MFASYRMCLAIAIAHGAFIELRVNGEGEGKMALATTINPSRDGTTIELENYRAQPIQLNQVRRRLQ